ncbi:MAG: (2Fe-2S)-binding protein [Pseudomonadota bacterium]
MYVCICNAIREREMERAVRDGSRTVADVFRGCGRRPQCGKCLPSVASLIEKESLQSVSIIAAE